MTEPRREYAYYPDGGIGGFATDAEAQGRATGRRYTVVQSLWTKPVLGDKARLRDTLFICALSLAYAHRSGYDVHMHTDSQGYELLKDFGYDELLRTLDEIPESVPTELFAAGKFYAMRAEGVAGKVHIDVDVFLKKPGILDAFYEDRRIDVICQQEESMEVAQHSDKIRHMLVMGYPAMTRPDWQGSLNTGVVGFNDPELATMYMSNYFEALGMYTKEGFDAYRKQQPDANLLFDFILEQITLSYMSLGFNVRTLVPMKEPTFVADKIGYQHLQGSWKWGETARTKVRQTLERTDRELFRHTLAVTGKLP